MAKKTKKIEVEEPQIQEEVMVETPQVVNNQKQEKEQNHKMSGK